MTELFDFSELRLYREKIVIAVAGAVDATFYADHDALIVPAFDLMELANELRHTGGEWVETDYREAVILDAMRRRGLKRVSKKYVREFDPAQHHPGALQWARDLLDQTQPEFAKRLFVEWGRQ